MTINPIGVFMLVFLGLIMWAYKGYQTLLESNTNTWEMNPLRRLIVIFLVTGPIGVLVYILHNVLDYLSSVKRYYIGPIFENIIKWGMKK